MITATEAKKLAETKAERDIERDLKNILDHIRDCAEMYGAKKTVFPDLKVEVREKLESLGFKLTDNQSVLRPDLHRSCIGTKISWE